MNQNEMIGHRIKNARKAKGMSQKQLADKLGVSYQAVSTWENDKYLPDSSHLASMAKELDLSVGTLFVEIENEWKLKPINIDAKCLYLYVKRSALNMSMTQTLAALELLWKERDNQVCRSKFGFKYSCIVHSLTMACHALAMGLKNDNIIAACLMHDILDNTNIKLENLPVNERIRDVVRLISKSMYNPNDPDKRKKYYENIRRNQLACMVICLDRVNNLAGMADVFSRRKMISYIEETDTEYPALLDIIKKVPEWNNAWWLLQYQLVTLLETFKRIL
ncbi:helix-turn-helix domain-containing protein [Aristaeella lactis]|uniref:GTP pyrophosphokinase n=1 Tax=Aristaeella lactis TaxID=3046383 RepID=A0AC61PL45_9FIRM|nr:helix-turn-helix transcriptional regulator [Aristaeella lactis]QUA52187.1 helix-turn-helix transcriptional regulator [Aristaeella lactis]SMC58540.1 GTP pyrophosphokinase [Aristaeella lactis]